jgi:glycosyltransferase involved in cell wall biosynthesis
LDQDHVPSVISVDAQYEKHVQREPMKICMLAYSFYEADARVRQYATALVERGDKVDVIALRQRGQPARAVLDGVNVYRVQVRTIDERGPLSYLYRVVRFLIVSGLFLAKRHLSERYQLVHVHSVPDFLVFAALVPKLTGTPVILDIHDVLPELYASKFHVSNEGLVFRLMVLLERISIAFANHVIVANHLWCERVALRSKRPEKCSPVRNYPASRLFSPEARNRASGKFLITYPGSLNWHQGVDVAISAFSKIKDHVPNAEFHIYGEGPAKQSLIDLAHSLNLDRRVIFHNPLPTDQIVKIMANTDLAVEPKRAGSAFGNEALSMKILEFMAVGVPLVVSRTKIHQFYYDDSLVTYYSDDNEDELAANMLRLMREVPLREQLVRNALKYVQKNNWEVEKSRYIRIVDSLCAQMDASKTSRHHSETGIKYRVNENLASETRDDAILKESK